MNETIKLPEKQKGRGWFFKVIQQNPILTYTFGFLFLFRFFGSLSLYFSGQINFAEELGLGIGSLLLLIPLIYVLQWLIVRWVISKNTSERLKEKLYRHPIATIIIFLLYISDLYYRLGSDLGIGAVKIINAFEIIIYYTFLDFLWWLLICWIIKKIWKMDQRFGWSWYKIIVDKVFIFLPLLYKLTLGLMTALFIFLLLFILLSGVLNYSGEDLQKLY